LRLPRKIRNKNDKRNMKRTWQRPRNTTEIRWEETWATTPCSHILAIRVDTGRGANRLGGDETRFIEFTLSLSLSLSLAALDVGCSDGHFYWIFLQGK
jgi:hypothetical protein